MKNRILIPLIILNLVITTTKAQMVAPSVTSEPVSLILSNVIDLELTSNGGNLLIFATPDNFNAGVNSDNATLLKVRSNKSWKVTVATATDTFTSSNSNESIPASILKVKLSNAESYLTLSSTPQNLNSGNRGNSNNNTFNVSYRAEPGFNYAGGNYQITLIYTATQP